MTNRRAQVSVDFITNIERLERDLARSERAIKRAQDLMKEQGATTDESAQANLALAEDTRQVVAATEEHTKALEVNHRMLAAAGELVRITVRDYGTLESQLISVVGQGSKVGSMFGGPIAAGLAIAGTAVAGLAYQLVRNEDASTRAEEALARLEARLEALGRAAEPADRIQAVSDAIDRQIGLVEFLTERRDRLAAVQGRQAEEASALHQAQLDLEAAEREGVRQVRDLTKALVEADVPFTQLHLLVSRLDGELRDAAESQIPNYRTRLAELEEQGIAWERTLLSNENSLAQTTRAIQTAAEASREWRRELKDLSVDALAAMLAVQVGMGGTLEEMEANRQAAIGTLRNALVQQKAERDTIEGLLDAADPGGRLRGLPAERTTGGAPGAAPTSLSGGGLAMIDRVTGRFSGLGAFDLSAAGVSDFARAEQEFAAVRAQLNRDLAELGLTMADLDARGLEQTDTYKELEGQVEATRDALKRIDLIEDLKLDPWRDAIAKTRGAIEEATQAEERRREGLLKDIERFLPGLSMEAQRAITFRDAVASFAGLEGQRADASLFAPLLQLATVEGGLTAGFGDTTVNAQDLLTLVNQGFNTPELLAEAIRSALASGGPLSPNQAVMNVYGNLTVVPESAAIEDVLYELDQAVTS